MQASEETWRLYSIVCLTAPHSHRPTQKRNSLKPRRSRLGLHPPSSQCACHDTSTNSSQIMSPLCLPVFFSFCFQLCICWSSLKSCLVVCTIYCLLYCNIKNFLSGWAENSSMAEEVRMVVPSTRRAWTWKGWTRSLLRSCSVLPLERKDVSQVFCM